MQTSASSFIRTTLTRLCDQFDVISLYLDLVLGAGGSGFHSLPQLHRPRVLFTEEVAHLYDCALLAEHQVDGEVSVDGTHLQLVTLRTWGGGHVREEGELGG